MHEPEEDEPPASSSSWMARPVEPSDTVADAIAALPHFESLKYPTKEECAGRRARSSPPASKEGDDDPCDDGRQYLPGGQGVREGEDDGRTGGNYVENYQRDKNNVDEILKLRIACAARGGRSYEAAIKNKFRHYIRRALEFNYRSSLSSWDRRW